MTSVSLFIQALPADNAEEDVALLKVKQLMKQGAQIKQVFFYQSGVLHANTPYSDRWYKLFPDTLLMLCSQYAEEYGIQQPPQGFSQQGLVDFFAKHWRLQSQLEQVT